MSANPLLGGPRSDAPCCLGAFSEPVANVLKNECGFFTIPRRAPLAELSGSAVKLYCALFDLAQRYSATRIEIPAYAIGGLVGLSKNTVRTAGQELGEKNLAVITKGERGLLAYELVNPETGALLQPPVRDANTGKRYIGVYRFTPQPGLSARALKNTPKPSPPAPAANIPWSEIGGSESQNLGTTKSNFAPRRSKSGILDSPTSLKTKELSDSYVSLKDSEKKGISEGDRKSKDSPEEKQAEEEATSFPFGFCASPDQ